MRKKKQLKTVKDSFSSVQSTKSSGSIRHSLGKIKTIFHLTDKVDILLVPVFDPREGR